ncbi:alpha-sialidase [Capnocytophaga canimorsus]|uniref:Alpha-sialidase n=1 Tax=Capnocytophaga canimorsus TaxID=28188 RepID=A0AAC9Z378_9FLAO|nr:DUF1735 domain-containing protein [Capnocytophaga canimorsus]ATA93603.1 alpha-sialidase [Capnocytophaga canimorsus]
MNRKIHIALGVLGVLTLFSCEKKYDDLIPPQYNTILLLKEEGERSVTLYSTGEDAEYDLTILKSGNAPDASAQVKLQVMSDTELEFYSQAIGRKYKALPASTYQLGEQDIAFASSEKYKKSKVQLKTNAIKQLLDGSNSDYNYVLPLELVKANSKDSVNADKKIVLLKPEVVIPVVNYSSNAASVNISTTDLVSYNFTMTLPFVSPWDFECQVAVSENTLLTSDQIFFENGGKVIFKRGRSVSEPVSIKVAKVGDFVGNKAIVPIKVISSTKSGIQLPETSFYLEVIYGGEHYKINVSASMLSTNEEELYEGGGQGFLRNMVDGNPETYFHSRWNSSGGHTSHYHYFSVDVGRQITQTAFSFVTRHNNSITIPQEIMVYVSQDGNNWTELQHITEGFPTQSRVTYHSYTVKSEQSFRYIRYEVRRNNHPNQPRLFALAEFTLYGK